MAILPTSDQEYDVSSDYSVVLIPRGVLRGGYEGIDSSGYRHLAVSNFGDIYATNNGIYLSSDQDSGSNVYNTSGANIVAIDRGIYIEEDNDSVFNSGSISSYFGIDTFLSIGTQINNSGSISSQSAGVNLENSGNFKFTNSGDILSQSYGVEAGLSSSNTASSIDNSGHIKGTNYSVYVTGQAGVISLNNSGTLDGNVFAGNATVNFINSGIVNGWVQLGSGSDTVKNFGTINGELDLYGLSGGNAEAIVNRGTIKGDVNLGNGGSIFDGRKGIVDGTIYGGTGADTIRAGNDGETFGGGGAHDVLYGGLGADTFQFASAASVDTDVVHQFNVAQDTIELSQSAFARLTVGQTPTFAVSTAATSPTDYLFYNAGTGGLYYDVNGSAAGGARLVATFDPGLNLTANNFSVV